MGDKMANVNPRQVILQDLAWKDPTTNTWWGNWVSGSSSAILMPGTFSGGGPQTYLQGYWQTADKTDLTGVNVLFGDLSVAWVPRSKTRSVFTSLGWGTSGTVPATADRIEFLYGGE